MPRHGDLQQSDILSDATPFPGANVDVPVSQHYWLMDHDTAEVNEAPPIQNTWYEVFHAQDVRLLWCTVQQINDEAAGKTIEIRWTIDGNVYLTSKVVVDTTLVYVSRTQAPSGGGTSGLVAGAISTAGYNSDKRGLDFEVEVRMTSVPGTNQTLKCDCVYETLEIT